MIHFRRAFLWVFVLVPGTQEIAALESLDVKLGYGGSWVFFTDTYSYTPLSGSGNSESHSGIAVGDVLSVSGDLRITQAHAVAALFNFGGGYAYFPSKNLALTYKYFPFDWYNEVFIGAGIDYLRIYPSENYPVDRVGAHLAYGLNIRFPANIFIVAEFRNIFFAPAPNRYGDRELTHNFQLIGSVCYRILLSESKPKSHFLDRRRQVSTNG